MRGCEGFSLVETLLAAALFALVALAAFEALRQLGHAADHAAIRQAALADVERLGASLRAEAGSAIAIWSASSAAGDGRDGCVELDFAAVDAAGPSFWSYRAFPHHESADAVPGDALERVAAAGPIPPCDASLPGRIVLRGLRVPPLLETIAPDALSAHADPYLGGPDAPFVAASVPAVPPVALPLADARGNPLAGGSRILEARFDTAAGSRTLDLLPGTFPTGFTEELHYTCSERCDIGHDTNAPKTLTRCTPGWQTAWSSAGFVAGTFTFTYSGTRLTDGGTDTLVRSASASNWDPARGYDVYPATGPAVDGTLAGSSIQRDVPNESAEAWLTELLPYVASLQARVLRAERDRCTAVRRAGEAEAYYVNG